MSYLKLAKTWSPQHLFMCLMLLLPIGVYCCFLSTVQCSSTLKMWLHCLYVGVLYKVRKKYFMWRLHLVCQSICDLASVTKLFAGFSWNSLQEYCIRCWANLNFMKIGPVTLILYWRHKWISTYSFHISWPIFMWFSVEDPHIVLVSSSEFVKHSALKGRFNLRAKIKFCPIFTSVAWCE